MIKDNSKFDDFQKRLTDFDEAGQSLMSNGGVIKGSLKGSLKPPISTDVPMITSVQQSLNPPRTRLVSIHKLPFVYSYEGTQPYKNADKISKLDRYGKTNQNKYDWTDTDKTVIMALPHTLKIWPKKARGLEIEEQLAEARERADNVARKFGMKYGLGNIIYLHGPEGLKSPDVIVEDRKVAKELKKIIKENPEYCRNEIGIVINQTSHKGKVELPGSLNGSESIDKAKVLRWLLTDSQNIMVGQGELLRQVSLNVSSLMEKVDFVVEFAKRNGK